MTGQPDPLRAELLPMYRARSMKAWRSRRLMAEARARHETTREPSDDERS